MGVTLLKRIKKLEDENAILRKQIASALHNTTDASATSLEGFRRERLYEIGECCTEAIYAGVEIGGKRYSLSEHDQIELMGQLSAVQNGATAVPYHADGELCTVYPAEDFLTVANAAMTHIFFHRTYCNHLNKWIRRAASIDEIQGIVYTGDITGLPPDLAQHIAGILGL